MNAESVFSKNEKKGEKKENFYMGGGGRKGAATFSSPLPSTADYFALRAGSH